MKGIKGMKGVDGMDGGPDDTPHRPTARERFRRVEAIFRAARELPAAERDRFLARECAGDDEATRAEVRGMLRADDRQGGALDQPALPTALRLGAIEMDADRSAAIPPRRIGRYAIVEVLGRGGMGTVYKALQESPRRSVALKVMNAGALSPGSLQRFGYEAQVLGRLQHPGIAQVFEAGVDDWGAGPQPYFAMELVDGRPLAEFAAQRRLDVAERLVLLARICDAAHHAHQKGVVHRDLKPANILVVQGAGDATTGSRGSSQDLLDAQPKILDFGVARVVDPDVEARTLQTGVGQVLGTLAYMSPEQASGAGAEVDIRSDIYSLGVIAFELLAGRLPHDLHHRPLAEALAMVRERPAPPLGAVDRTLRGDVETIVAKALARDPAQRYASAAEMAADLRRVVRREPIQARRAGTIEQLARIAHRHRGLVAVGALAVVALVAAAVVSLRSAIAAEGGRAEQERLRRLADVAAVGARREAYRARIVAASAALGANDVVEGRRQLEAAPEEDRAWEWSHLWSRLDDSMAAARIGMGRHPRVAFSPDGGTLVAADTRGSLHRWRMADVARGVDLPSTTSIPGDFRVRWTRDAWFDRDGATVRVATRSALHTFEADALAPIGLVDLRAPLWAIDHMGRHAVIEAGDRSRPEFVADRVADRARLVDLGPRTGVDPVGAFSRDGDLLAVYTGDPGGLSVWSMKDGGLLDHWPDVRGVSEVEIDPEGRVVAAAMLDGTTHLLPIDASGPPIILVGHQAPVICATFAPDGRCVATAASDHTVRLWSALDGRALALFRGNDAAPTSLRFSPDGTQLASACADGVVRFWSVVEHRDPFVLPTPQTVYSLAFTPDGTRLAAACLGGDRPVRIWDVATCVEVAAFGDGTPSAVAFDPSGSRLAIGRSHGDTAIVVAEDGTPIATTPGMWWRTDWVGFGADGSQLLCIANSGRLRRCDASTGRIDANTKLEGRATDLGARGALSPDRHLLAATAGVDVLLIEPSTFERRGTLAGHAGRVHAVAFSPDGAMLATGAADRTIRIWDLTSKRTIAVFEGSTATILALAWSPDGRRIASGGRDRTIRLWDAETGDEVVRLHGHRSLVYCLAWSPDGRRLASGGGDDTVRLWDTRALRDVLTARRDR